LATNIVLNETQLIRGFRYSIDSSKATVNNSAIAGRSARSFTEEGHFDGIAEVLNPGDWVVIEFGHNDGGMFLSYNTTDFLNGGSSRSRENNSKGMLLDRFGS
jgi:rhamnogalacturonan acetylesterase